MRRHPNMSARHCALAGACLLATVIFGGAATSCGSDDTAEPDDSSTPEQQADGTGSGDPSGEAITVSAGSSATPASTEVLAELIEAEISGSSVEVGSESLEVTLPQGGDAGDLAALLSWTANLEFRPVLEFLGPAVGPAEVTPPEEITSSEEATMADTDGIVYRLGPVHSSGDRFLDGRSIESADAEMNQVGQWVVTPLFREGADGVELFNEIAESCFDGDPSCPAATGQRGQLAIVFGDRILTAPVINEPSFQRDQIEISGSFDQEGARRVAIALTAGAGAFTLED